MVHPAHTGEKKYIPEISFFLPLNLYDSYYNPNINLGHSNVFPPFSCEIVTWYSTLEKATQGNREFYGRDVFSCLFMS